MVRFMLIFTLIFLKNFVFKNYQKDLNINVDSFFHNISYLFILFCHLNLQINLI